VAVGRFHAPDAPDAQDSAFRLRHGRQGRVDHARIDKEREENRRCPDANQIDFGPSHRRIHPPKRDGREIRPCRGGPGSRRNVNSKNWP